MKWMMLIALAMVVAFVSGCSTTATSGKNNLTAFEGSWSGRDVTGGQNTLAILTVSGRHISFRGSAPNDWLTGTFTLHEETDPKGFVGVITGCAASEYIGQKTYAIYKLNGDTLTMTGNAPGVRGFPAAFDSEGTRQFAFQRVK